MTGRTKEYAVAADFDGEVEAKIMEVTPEMAEEWLEQNLDHNRAVRQSKVEEYARDMAEGCWAVNGDAIRFNGDGTLIDGQHRLWACIEAGVSFRTVVIRGVPTEAYATIDRGRKRSVADVLSARGVSRYTKVHTICRTLWMWQHGYLDRDRPRPTDREVLATFDDHPDTERWAIWATRLRKVISRPTLGAALVYIFKEVSTEADAQEFAESLHAGAGLTRDDPLLLLRDRLVRDKDAKESLKRRDWMALFIKTWNYRREGRTVKILKWAENESFPEIQ